MEEFRKQLIILSIFIVILGVFVVIYKSDYFWNFAKGLPFHTNSQNCTKLNSGICLAEDAGLRLNYYEASSLCRKRGMTLPTREDAWLIWINSENCHRVFASNIEVPTDKKSFIAPCKNEGCNNIALNVKNYCLSNPSIKFPRAPQYQDGYFWLKDNAGNESHYTINYSTGHIRTSKDFNKALGVRCINPNKK